jgi:uroporphyrinogen-III synthase
MRRLIVLRPEPGASETVARARALGLDAEAMPLFEVEPLAWQAPDAGSFDAILLTSANAVRHAGAKLKHLRGLPVHAVGEATAEAARDSGFDIRSTGDKGVERLLGSIETDLRLLHLCGEHRRPLEAKQSILAIPVYRSAELPVPKPFGAIGRAVAALHSPRAAERFSQLVDEARLERKSIRVAAISESALAAAGAGWEEAKAAEMPQDGALLAVAARLCEKLVQR